MSQKYKGTDSVRKRLTRPVGNRCFFETLYEAVDCVGLPPGFGAV
jgi:hypothetical protein